MSQGKYSPTARFDKDENFIYNAYGQVPREDWTKDEYKVDVHFACYNKAGYDGYGYSGLDNDGNYVGIGEGVDRLGNTESDYLSMDEWAMEQALADARSLKY